jgi:rhamnosyltransferase
MMRFSLIVPTLNAGADWTAWIDALCSQRELPLRTLVIDSGSSDNTVETAKRAGLEVYSISPHSFNHGGTRQLGVEMLRNDCEVLVFLTQDAILADPNALGTLVASFDNPRVGAAYGRQLPHDGAGPMGAHARLFNYGEKDFLKGKNDIAMLGIKSCFISNSFSAYRLSALDEVGGFPKDVILGEDACVAGRLILSDWLIQYLASAQVRHSHDYSALEDFRRYFDTGVLHAREQWILASFGDASGEGLRYLRSELAYVRKFGLVSCLVSLQHTVFKYVGYRLGRLEKYLPPALKQRMSMFRKFWISQ